jgi:hypothetical protein
LIYAGPILLIIFIVDALVSIYEYERTGNIRYTFLMKLDFERTEWWTGKQGRQKYQAWWDKYKWPVFLRWKQVFLIALFADLILIAWYFF